MILHLIEFREDRLLREHGTTFQIAMKPYQKNVDGTISPAEGQGTVFAEQFIPDSQLVLASDPAKLKEVVRAALARDVANYIVETVIK